MRRYKDIPALQRLRCGILYNISPSCVASEAKAIQESVEFISEILEHLGHSVKFFPVHKGWKRLFSRLAQNPCDVIVNLCEGYLNCSEGEFFIACALELLGIPFTGASAYALGICQNKPLLKKMLHSLRILTPASFVYPDAISTKSLTFPLILKLAMEDGSLGLSADNVVYNEQQFRKRIKALHQEYQCSILVEEYIHGREFEVGLWEEEVLPIEEIVFYIEPRILCFQSKWVEGSAEDRGTVAVCPAEIPPSLTKKLIRLAQNVRKVLGYMPYCRVDIRMDEKGALYVLEVNPNPDITHQAGYRLMLEKTGYSFENFIAWLIANALQKCQKSIH